MKLLDTDIFIDFFQGIPEAVRFFRENADEIIFSSITEAELLAGRICDHQSEKEKVLHLLAQFEKIPVDNPLVQIAGDFRRKYDIELPDALIAASTFMVGAQLITRNARDFKKVKEITVKVPY